MSNKTQTVLKRVIKSMEDESKVNNTDEEFKQFVHDMTLFFNEVYRRVFPNA
tara:strand:- start:1751 stop:1906 length:156 start_codon:yes stop_codon:yes gene_type:complete